MTTSVGPCPCCWGGIHFAASNPGRRTFLKRAMVATSLGVVPTLMPKPAFAAQEPIPQGRILIRGATVLSLDDKVGNLARGDILIDAGQILAVAPRLDADLPERNVIVGEGRIVLPGFVDAHRHTHQVLIRNLNSDQTFDEYFKENLTVYPQHHRPEEMYIGNLLGAVEALNAGVTTIQDWCFNLNTPEHADAAIQGLQESGIRGIFGYGAPQYPFDQWWDLRRPSVLSTAPEVKRVKTRHFASTDQLLTLAVAARGPAFTTPEINRQEWEAARDVGARITVHINGAGLIKAMADYLGPDTVHVHCLGATDDEMKLIRDSGGFVTISPEATMGLHGEPMTTRALAFGLTPSISVDSCAPFSGDMFVQMRMALQQARMVALHDAEKKKAPLQSFPPGLYAKDVLRWATIEGARAYGLDGKVGSITPGKRADLIILRTDALELTPLNDPVAAAVFSALPHHVETVLIDGIVKKHRGALVGVDLGRIRKLAIASRDHLFAASGVPSRLKWFFAE